MQQVEVDEVDMNKKVTWARVGQAKAPSLSPKFKPSQQGRMGTEAYRETLYFPGGGD